MRGVTNVEHERGTLHFYEHELERSKGVKNGQNGPNFFIKFSCKFDIGDIKKGKKNQNGHGSLEYGGVPDKSFIS